MKNVLFFVILFLAFSAVSRIAYAQSAEALLTGTEDGSTLQGTVQLEETASGLKVTAQVTGAPAGLHGFHIHENGSCEDKGNAAGSHFNPDGVAHGHLPVDGFQAAHAGDLGNLTINEAGSGEMELLLPELSLTSGKYNVMGKAVILHANHDDFGQPTGNAGGRIACGIITAKQ